MGDYDFYDPEQEFQLERAGFERIHTVGLGGDIGALGIQGTQLNEMLKSEKDKFLIRVQMILRDLQIPYHVNIEGIYKDIEKIPRVEFYNPFGLILGFVFKLNKLQFPNFSKFYKDVKKSMGSEEITSPDLLRYVRFVKRI